MGLKDLDLKRSYIAPDTGIQYAYNTLLSNSVTLDRAAGFFSSSVFKYLEEGLKKFIFNNNGKIRLITSVELSEDVYDAVMTGYQMKKSSIPELEYAFEFELNKIEDENLRMLARLVAMNSLEIKIAIPTKDNKETGGIFHDKLSVFRDKNKDCIVFCGSPNDSENALAKNYEKIRLVKGWVSPDDAKDEAKEFDDLWYDTHLFCRTYDFIDSANKIIQKEAEKRGLSDSGEFIYEPSSSNEFHLRKYQEEAIEAWANNGYIGFYTMATGTGKTLTSLYGIKRLEKEEKELLPIVVVPYIHLVTQWSEDIEKVFPDYKIIEVSSETPKWKNLLSVYRELSDEKIFIVSTIDSYLSKEFINKVSKYNKKKVLVVDEAHNYASKLRIPQISVDYKLGLSATPSFGKNKEKSDELLKFFDKVVYKYDLEDAINNKYLVNYYYNPYYVTPSDDEEEEFNITTRKMIALSNNKNSYKSMEGFSALASQRHRILANIQDKINKIDSIVDFAGVKNHLIIYCGDSKSISGTDNVVMSYLEKVYDELVNKGIKTNKFTAKEDKATRADLVELFNKGVVNCLTAIRCLDEGINIKSIQTAIILSSANNYREYVQRRGRILRLCDGKKYANIVDVITLPSANCPSMAKVELRRFYEYARLAINKEELFKKLAELMVDYDLTFDDLKIDFSNEEEAL